MLLLLLLLLLLLFASSTRRQQLPLHPPCGNTAGAAGPGSGQRQGERTRGLGFRCKLQFQNPAH
jgi:hypothetical protein